MKPALKISILLNLALLGGLIFVVVNQRKESPAIAPRVIVGITNAGHSVSAPSAAASSGNLPESFRWNQLVSTNDYRDFVANLRAVGCPESTIRDIVTGDARFAFALKRKQLGLDGSGSGPWSRQQEAQTVAAMLGEQPLMAEDSAPAQSAGGSVRQNGGTEAAVASASTQGAEQTSYRAVASAPVYPLVYQKVNLDALGFNASQKAAVAQVQQQFVNDIGDPNQSPSDSASLAKWQTAQISANDTLRGLLGTQAYMAYEQQLYIEWFQSQVQAASASGTTLTINPALFNK